MRVIQIDEAALREGLPLRKSQWQRVPATGRWNAFRITANGVRDETQIHTHMCCSEFNDIIASIADMDADVITDRDLALGHGTARCLRRFQLPNQIRPGRVHIHSPNIPARRIVLHTLRRRRPGTFSPGHLASSLGGLPALRQWLVAKWFRRSGNMVAAARPHAPYRLNWEAARLLCGAHRPPLPSCRGRCSPRCSPRVRPRTRCAPEPHRRSSQLPAFGGEVHRPAEEPGRHMMLSRRRPFPRSHCCGWSAMLAACPSTCWWRARCVRRSGLRMLQVLRATWSSSRAAGLEVTSQVSWRLDASAVYRRGSI